MLSRHAGLMAKMMGPGLGPGRGGFLGRWSGRRDLETGGTGEYGSWGPELACTSGLEPEVTWCRV